MHTTLDQHDLPPPDDQSHPPQHRAAFFGLDQTLIPGSSLFLLAQGLHERELYGTRDMLRFAWEQLRFRIGPSEVIPQIESSKDAALEFVAGRHRPDVEALAREIAQERIVPRVYPGMARLIDQHRSAGDLTFVTTAAPAEVAQVVAEGLDMTGGLGTRAEVDGAQRYSGRLEGALLHGTAKASAVEAHAAAAGIDLEQSTAYSDSISDLPLLELVGRPEVVNPDERLRRVADDRGWPVHHVGGVRPDRRRASMSVHHRVAGLGLTSPLRPVRLASRGRTHHFHTDNPDRLVRELEASGRFRRDTRLGRLFHPGQISLREVAPRESLHIIVDEGTRVAAHIDHYSPLAHEQPDIGCRYSLSRIAAHNVLGMASDLARLVPGRRGPHTCCPDPKTQDQDEPTRS